MYVDDVVIIVVLLFLCLFNVKKFSSLASLVFRLIRFLPIMHVYVLGCLDTQFSCRSVV